MKKEEFLSAGVHIGMKSRTKYMYDSIYKIRSDGLTVMNLQEILSKIQKVGKFLARFDPSKIVVVAGRDQAKKPVKKFAELTGVKTIIGRFYPGTFTNYISSADVVFVTDIIADKQAITEAMQMGIPVVALCNVNDIPTSVDVMIPCNNKGRKSLAAVFWALATHYLRARGDLPQNKDLPITLEEYTKG